jgi:membrane protease YdiL (CAAX protease family)
LIYKAPHATIVAMNGHPIASIVGLLLALGVTTLFAFLKQGGKSAPIDQSRHLAVTWSTCLALLALMLFWERLPLSSIGIVWGNYWAWFIGVVIGGAILSTSVISIWMAGKSGKPAIPEDSEQGLMRVMATPLWFRWAVVLTAGITEEIMFRGYPIERLLEITGNLWLSAAIPLAVFVFAHLSAWSLGHLVGVFFGGAVLTGLYLWQRDLVACMIAHALIDSLIIFLPAMLKKLAAHSANQVAAS